MPNTRINLFKKEVDDLYQRENSKRVMNFLRDNPLFKGKFEFAEYTIKMAATNLKIPHHFDFVPKDAFIVYKSDPSVTVTLNQNLWDGTNINVTTSGPVVIRLFIGRYGESDA